jgi:16S rRNA (guanine966-N2)-methyltransferase
VTLRIIAGELGGRRIDTPPGSGTRPTREAVREAWFSALAERLHESRVLDLFAGSGALGIEALSRGATVVSFVEADRHACEVLRKNLERLGIEDRTEVRCGDAERFVENLARARRRDWDIVVADPPYEGRCSERLVEAFDRFSFASVLCVEHAPGIQFSREADWHRRYGETALSFFVDPKEGTRAHE